MLDYGEFVPEALAKSTHPVLAKLGTKLDLVPTDGSLPYEGEEHCVERVVAGTHAHVETYSYLLLLFRSLGHSGQVYPLKEQLYPGNLAFFFAKNTPWKYKFDIGMRRLVEAGLVWHWYSELMEDYKHSIKVYFSMYLRIIYVNVFAYVTYGKIQSLIYTVPKFAPLLAGRYSKYRMSPTQNYYHATNFEEKSYEERIRDLNLFPLTQYIFDH